MSLNLPFGVRVLNPQSVDDKYLSGGTTPYTSVAAVNSSIVAGIRHRGLTVNVLGEEYWYKNGISNGDLVLKFSGGTSSSNVRGVENAITISYTATTSSDYVGASGATTIYMPVSPLTGQQVTISDEVGDANTTPITIDGNGNLIDNASTALINTDYGSITILYNGTFWKVISFSN